MTPALPFALPLAPLRFLTAGSVDDGKSTLIGRLLLDSHAISADQMAALAHPDKPGEIDLSRLTDGLQAEREQAITMDVAYRYFATADRQFIMADAPGHEAYTRHMVTAASNSDAAIILVDPTKLHWQQPLPDLLPQTRRHALLAQLLRVPSIVFAINKLDAVANPAKAFTHVKAALQHFARQAHINIAAIIPISALQGINVTQSITPHTHPQLASVYQGPALLPLLAGLPAIAPETALPLHFPVQFVEKSPSGSCIYWGRIATGTIHTGQTITLLPGGAQARVRHLQANALDTHNTPLPNAQAGQSVGITLDRHIPASRGNWLLASTTAAPMLQQARVTIAWLDNTPLTPGRTYRVKHGAGWLQAQALNITHQLNINTLQPEHTSQIQVNQIGEATLQFQHPLPLLPYTQSRQLGALILVDTASNHTVGAGMVTPQEG